MGRALVIFLLAAGCSVGAWSLPVQPDSLWPEEEPLARVTAGPVSLAQATALATQRFPGRVVRAETASHGARREHRIRILGGDGRVRTVRIDAQTGAFL